MKHFYFSEFFNSSAAAENGIKNEPALDERGRVMLNIKLLVDNVLEPVRDMVCNPIIITSGYRNPQLNKIVGGADNSQHMLGCAADFYVRGYDPSMMHKVFLDISNMLEFDQLIYYPIKNIIHVSYVENRNRHEAFIKK